jgi:hypothetical protein
MSHTQRTLSDKEPFNKRRLGETARNNQNKLYHLQQLVQTTNNYEDTIDFHLIDYYIDFIKYYSNCIRKNNCQENIEKITKTLCSYNETLNTNYITLIYHDMTDAIVQLLEIEDIKDIVDKKYP